jgi:hypothetical protein
LGAPTLRGSKGASMPHRLRAAIGDWRWLVV